MDYIEIEGLYDRCTSAIHALRFATQNPVLSASFHSLVETLTLQQNILKNRKRGQHNKRKKDYDLSHSAASIGPWNHDERTVRGGSVEEMLLPSGSEGLKGFSDVIGLEEPKMLLREACIFPLQYSQLYTGAIRPWSRILLYGPPGTGKTRLAKALAAELNGNFYCASSASLLSSWIGESEKLIQELFHNARSKSGHSVVFIDEIDSLCRQRTMAEDEHTRRVKTELLRQLDSSADEGGGRVFVLAATNCPWDMDCAFLRRFQRRILISIPEKEERKLILMTPFKADSINMSDRDWEVISSESDGYSGADLSHLAMAAAFKPLRELQTARFWSFTKGDKIIPCSNETLGAMQFTLEKLPPEKVMTRPVELKDFLDALKSTPKTVSEEILLKYADFAKQS